MRYVAIGGAVVDRDLYAFVAAFFSGAVVADTYGATETGGITQNGFPGPAST